MRRIETIEELRQLQLGILDCVAKFCDEHQIKYWLDFGTLLGAIRHKGYIPWDDDIDISMKREDYKKFVSVFNELNYNKRYSLHCFEKDLSYPWIYGKVFDDNTVAYSIGMTGFKRAVNIDVFVLDNAPDNDDELDKTFCYLNFYRRLDGARKALTKPSGNFLRRMCVYFLSTVLKIFPVDYFIRKADETIQKYNSITTKRVSNFTAWQRNICRKEAFDELIDVDFEGRKYKAPIGYHEWLRVNYGDYMQLPPITERVSHHNFEAYMLED